MITPELLEAEPVYYDPLGVTAEQAAHIVILGYGRAKNGMESSDAGLHRADFGALAYLGLDRDLLHDDAGQEAPGVFASLGYKSPGDTMGKGVLWTPSDTEDPNQQYGPFQGVPESYLLDARVEDINPELEVIFGRGISPKNRRREAVSFTTPTNITEMEAQKILGEGDERPVIFVGQQKHVEDTIDNVAPKTARRDYLGLVVPVIGGTNNDSGFSRLARKPMIVGLSSKRGATPETEEASRLENARRAARNSRVVWAITNLVLGGKDSDYHAEKSQI
jgi:hypothetical protein